MSYFDLPRVHFGGQFQASPSTLNNTPNNYAEANWTREKTELYWAPDGDGIFDLFECTVTSVVTSDPGTPVDPLQGLPVIAAYTKAPPKIVDLDPMQQNVSELWGMLMQFGDPGGAFVRGVFEPISFNGIWGVAQGLEAPHSSASGSAVFQTMLTSLVWNAGGSTVLEALQAASPDRLSLNMVVKSHNNIPDTYLFDDATYAAMGQSPNDVPSEVIDQLRVLSRYRMMSDDTAGLLPTSAYVTYQLRQLLGEQVAKQYIDTVLAVTRQPYSETGSRMPTDFNFGQIVGSLGPAAADEPTYVVPARTLAPPATTNDKTGVLTPQGPCWWAQAKLHRNADGTGRLTLNLGNSLPVEFPGTTIWAKQLGTLSLAYESPPGSGTYVTLAESIDYGDAGGLMTHRAGVVDIDLTAEQASAVASAPLVLRGTEAQAILLQENPEGLSARADQFVFRMNPGMPGGDSAQVDVHVRKFGEVAGTEGLQVELAKMSPKTAANYTVNTLGTSGTKGIENLSVPEGALEIGGSPAPVRDGVASFQLTAADPGNPRGYLDGNVYFARYSLTPGVPGYFQDPNDIVSAQVYEHTTLDGPPTWTGGISTILSQFGRLYPIMAAFDLGDYDTVVRNATAIRGVLARDIADPLHMPVTRDLSESRRALVLAWIDAGTPR